MRILVPVIVLGACLASAGPVRAGGPPAEEKEKKAKSKIVSVGLFKNGLVVVRREVSLPEAGTYRLGEVPDAVHGTFWVESEAKVEARVKTREVDVPAHEAGQLSLQEELAGRKVTIHLKGGKVPAVTGQVLSLKRPPGEPAAAERRFLVLKTARGRAYVDASEVASVEVDGDSDTVKRRKAMLYLTVGKADKGPKVHVSYLTTGLSWAPSYRLDISDPKTLRIEQAAVIRNEMGDLKDAEVSLISGYPSVAFAHVLSPLSAKTNWENFFRQLGQDGMTMVPSLSNSVTRQQAIPGMVSGLSLGATPAGEGVDLHYQGIGKRTLAKGEALSLSLAKAKTSYERIVEWPIPDNRDEYGRYAARWHDAEEDQPWDAVRFKNPFPFPMTTAPATVVAGEKFNGQRPSYYVSVGEENVVRVTRALSIRTRSTEQEEKDKNGREIVYVGGREYRKATITAEVKVSNHRKEAVKLVIRRRFSGELLSAEGAPKTTLLAEGVWSANRRNELVWTLTLPSGQERRLTYRYAVLVLN